MKKELVILIFICTTMYAMDRKEEENSHTKLFTGGVLYINPQGEKNFYDDSDSAKALDLADKMIEQGAKEDRHTLFKMLVSLKEKDLNAFEKNDLKLSPDELVAQVRCLRKFAKAEERCREEWRKEHQASFIDEDDEMDAKILNLLRFGVCSLGVIALSSMSSALIQSYDFVFAHSSNMTDS